jgi:hypothetical protein
MQAPTEPKDGIGEFYKKTYGASSTKDAKERPKPTTVYEKGQYLMELRQRPLSVGQTVAVVLGTTLVTVIFAYAVIAILK